MGNEEKLAAAVEKLKEHHDLVFCACGYCYAVIPTKIEMLEHALMVQREGKFWFAADNVLQIADEVLNGDFC